MRLDDYKNALSFAKRAYKKDPKNMIALNNIGRAYLDPKENKKDKKNNRLIVKGKNQSARSLLNDNDLEYPVLTADTLVFTPSRKIVGKPENHEHSRELLREFSGATHSVFSTVMISTIEKSILKTCETKVSFKNMTKEEIEEYVCLKKELVKPGLMVYMVQQANTLTNIEVVIQM